MTHEREVQRRNLRARGYELVDALDAPHKDGAYRGRDLDPDPLRPPDNYDPDPRVPASGWEHRRIAATDGRPGMVIVYVSFAFLVGIALACLISLASRSGPNPTAPSPTDMAGLARVSTSAESASGSGQSSAALPAWNASSETGSAAQANIFTVRRWAGTATWYCGTTATCTKGYGPSDMVAAIDTDLGFRKGQRVTVRAFGRAVTVRIVDVCGCPGKRLIDLSRGAFSRLANPDYGVIAVTIERAGSQPIPVAPATDTGAQR